MLVFGWENKASETEDVCATMNSMCPLLLCLETRKARLAEGFIPSSIPGGSDLGLLRSLPFSLALSLPWFPGDQSRGIKARSGGREPVSAVWVVCWLLPW